MAAVSCHGGRVMTQNRSSAVMQQRREPPDSLDYFPTPPWATRAFCDWLTRRDFIPDRTGDGTLYAGPDESLPSCWEPACGAGHMVHPLMEFFWPVRASDVHDYSEDFVQPCGLECHQDRVQDFTIDWDGPARSVDWIITNPPFRLAERFIERACRIAQQGVAMFVRTSFLEGEARHRSLFSTNPPSWVLQHVERVPLVKARLDENASSATSYCWLVWIDGEDGTRLDWIPKCRHRFERSWDYPSQWRGEDDSALALFEVSDG